MSSKISDLPAATNAPLADLLTIVQSGVNKKTTKAILLSAVVAENIGLLGANANSLLLDAGGDVAAIFASGQAYTVRESGGHTFIDIDSLSTMALATDHQPLTIADGTGSILHLDGIGGLAIQALSGSNPNIQYNPTSPGNYAGSAPTTLVTALKRIEDLLVTLNGGAIP